MYYTYKMQPGLFQNVNSRASNTWSCPISAHTPLVIMVSLIQFKIKKLNESYLQAVFQIFPGLMFLL